MKITGTLAVVLVLVGIVGCQAAPAKHYAIQGEVIGVDVPRKLLTVKHGDIPGFMPAMTMSYSVAEEKEIAGLKPGDNISADLVVSENKGQLEKIVRVAPQAGTAPADPGNK